MAVILTIAFIIVYILILIKWNKWVSWRFNASTSRVIKYTHYISLFVVMVVAFSYLQYGIGLRSLWTTRFFIFLIGITGLVFSFVSAKSAVNKLEGVYFRAFSFLPVVMGFVFMIPFLGVVLVISLLGRLFEPAEKIYYEDNKLRIQSTFYGALGRPRIDIFEKKGLFEKLLSQPNFFSEDIDSVRVKYDNDSTRVIVYNLSKKDHLRDSISLKRVD